MPNFSFLGSIIKKSTSGYPIPLSSHNVNFWKAPTMRTRCCFCKKYTIKITLVTILLLEIGIFFGNLQLIKKDFNELDSFFNYKDRMPAELCSRIIYKFQCESCNDSYLYREHNEAVKSSLLSAPRHFAPHQSSHYLISFLTPTTL